MAELVPAEQRKFAVEVVRRLRTAGFEAYWAGGCVRDQLLGTTPKDYDVATDATPPQIRKLFGKRRTLAIGAAFGVITVLGPKPAGQIEVATFRRDAAYTDGRHPDRVTFSTAREDASRRDFTINGVFYDPIEDRVLDFVGGQEDLKRGVIRAIGDPHERFAEDKLRMLRAVRFAATFRFPLDDDTLAAIRRMADQITVVSPERIATEMRRLLVAPARCAGVRLLVDSGLDEPILPEIVPADAAGARRLDHALAVLDRLVEPNFPLALAALLHPMVDAPRAKRLGRRWRLANHETHRTAWLIANHAALDRARSQPWSRVQPILIADGIRDLLALAEAIALTTSRDTGDVAWCRGKLTLSREVLDPPPLVTGNDLIRHGVRPGPLFSVFLRRVRDAQLDGHIHTAAEALALVDRLRSEE